MAGEWKRVAVDEVCELIVDCVNKTAPVVEGLTPYKMLRTTNIKGGRIDREECRHVSKETFVKWTRRADVRRGDVILTREAPLGEVGYVDFDDTVFLGQRLMQYRPNPALLEPRYLLYSFLSKDLQNQFGAHEGSGSTVSHIRVGDCSKFQLSLPPLAEQKAIAAVLGALDDKIELNRRMNATLEAMARALFQSWFVDFEPVRAKLDGRQPVGLDPATAALFPVSFDETELGQIPHGWQVKTIDELAERVAMGPFGSDIKVSTFVPEGIPVISGQHLRTTLLYDSEFNFVSSEHADRLKRSNVHRGDVIFTHAGSIGQVAYIPEASRYERYIVSQRQFYMRCKRALVSPFYITSYFKTPEGQHRLLANTSSTGVPSISQPVTYLRQLKMVVPPLDLLKIFDVTVGQIHLKMADNLHQSRSLASLRDTVLPKLLSGELSIAQLRV
jgi:type I restriction enzyme S subunit